MGCLCGMIAVLILHGISLLFLVMKKLSVLTGGVLPAQRLTVIVSPYKLSFHKRSL